MADNHSDILACGICGAAHLPIAVGAGEAAYCSRCGARLRGASGRSLQVTAALCLAALLLYLPANVLPIMRMTLYGATTENTVWQGCVRLYRSGDVPVAAVVFLASMLVPLLKLLGLMMLVATTGLRSGRWRRLRSRVFRGIETIGRWAMLDVFVLAVLVSLMKLRALATVVPARGALPFTAVVVLTVLASASFEPQLIWSRRRSAERRAGPRASGLTPNLQRTPARPPEGTNA